MNECKDAYDAGIFTGELHSSMEDCHTIRTQEGGIIIDFKKIRREGVQVKIEIQNMDFFVPHNAPIKLLIFHSSWPWSNNKILKIKGKLLGVEDGAIIMRQDPFKLELNHADVWEEAKAEVADEIKREKIDDIKQKLRTRKSFWDRVFPWAITIRRK